MGFALPAGHVIVAARTELGLTQEQLASSAKVSVRTVQRAEKGARLRLERLSQMARALHMSTADLLSTGGLSAAKDIADEFTCRHCGARLSERVYVDHEYGDAELDRFECGAEKGWQNRPCPKDPQFPPFEDFELQTYQEADYFYAYALGKTTVAQSVHLDRGRGRTKESAEKWVHRSYIATRFGHDAAERFYPVTEHTPNWAPSSEQDR